MSPRLHSEEGSALLIVLAVAALLSLMIAVSFGVARQSVEVAVGEGDTHAALAAADAGLDDYLFRLNSVDEYWRYSDTVSPPDGNLSLSGQQCLDEFALSPEAADMPSCNFVPIPGGEGVGEFTLVPDASRLEQTGSIVVTALGHVGSRVRAIEAAMNQESFLDYLYFTDFETLSPVAYSTPSNQAWAEANCSVHRWEAPSGDRPSGCIEIYWQGDDRVNGPFHTNDRWRISGNPTWEGDASGSAIDGVLYTGSGSPNFNGGPAFYQEPLQMPPSNTQIKAFADHTLGADGCLYTGPTAIVMNADGTLTVRSPYTRDSGTGCGTFPNASAQTVAMPTNGVIYVQSIPSDPLDPNYTASCPAGNNGLGYPIAGDVNTGYSCRYGDAFVEGTLDGRLTIAAENNIIITWHIDYEVDTDDMLGLVANEFVQIYHPVNSSDVNLPALPNHSTVLRDIRIDAAVLSVTESFMVQRWRGGYNNPLGTITLNGAIAQIYRGPVGTFSSSTGVQRSGYDKDYNYDQRLRFTNPPNFINPVLASWRIAQYAEQF